MAKSCDKRIIQECYYIKSHCGRSLPRIIAFDISRRVNPDAWPIPPRTPAGHTKAQCLLPPRLSPRLELGSGGTGTWGLRCHYTTMYHWSHQFSFRTRQIPSLSAYDTAIRDLCLHNHFNAIAPPSPQLSTRWRTAMSVFATPLRRRAAVRCSWFRGDWPSQFSAVSWHPTSRGGNRRYGSATGEVKIQKAKTAIFFPG